MNSGVLVGTYGGPVASRDPTTAPVLCLILRFLTNNRQKVYIQYPSFIWYLFAVAERPTLAKVLGVGIYCPVVSDPPRAWKCSLARRARALGSVLYTTTS